MKQLFVLSALIAFGMVFSCSRHDELSELKKGIPTEDPVIIQDSTAGTSDCLTKVIDLKAGQHIDAGNVTVSNDATNIYVTFNTTNGWVLKESHLYVGPLSGLPVGNNGNPKIGNFPYKAAHYAGETTFTYTIPLNNIAGQSCIVIAAHAAVEQISADGSVIAGETAWASGNQIADGGSWASYFEYCICEGGTSTAGTTSGSTTGSTTGGSTDGSTTGNTTDGSTTGGTTGGTTDGSTTGGTTGGTTEGSTTGGSTGGTTDGSTTGGMEG